MQQLQKNIYSEWKIQNKVSDQNKCKNKQ